MSRIILGLVIGLIIAGIIVAIAEGYRRSYFKGRKDVIEDIEESAEIGPVDGKA